MKIRLIGAACFALIAQTSHGVTQVAPVKNAGNGRAEICGPVQEIETAQWKEAARIIHHDNIPINPEDVFVLALNSTKTEDVRAAFTDSSAIQTSIKADEIKAGFETVMKKSGPSKGKTSADLVAGLIAKQTKKSTSKKTVRNNKPNKTGIKNVKSVSKTAKGSVKGTATKVAVKSKPKAKAGKRKLATV